MRCSPSGPTNALIAAVGEAPGEAEEEKGEPFIGWSGMELTRMLTDAGIDRSDVFLTNVCRDRPPKNDIDAFINPLKTKREGEVEFRGRWVLPQVVADHADLVRELVTLKPKVILALGNTPIWALTSLQGKGNGVGKWRGSYLNSDVPGLEGTIVLPAYHPAYILRAWGERFVTVQDFRRAKGVVDKKPVRPPYRFILDPSYDQVINTLTALLLKADKGPLRLVQDLEIKRGEIVCYGLAWSKLDAICVPFYKEAFREEAGSEGAVPPSPLPPSPPRRVRMGVPSWTPEQATEIWVLTKRLLEHPNARLCNQNIPFDLTFLFEDVGFWPRVAWDTMLAQHVLFPGEPKALDYLASLYNEWYVYWKDDGKFWDKPIVFPQLWEYNCIDAVATFEVWEEQEKAIAKLGFEKQMAFQLRLLPHVQQMMFRGVRVDRETKRRILRELFSLTDTLKGEATFLAGRDLMGPKGGFSTQKLAKFLYTDLGIKPITKTVKFITRVTCDDDALMRVGKAEPWLRPFTERVNQCRSYGTAISACASKVDKDDRWRCAYKMTGTENYRFSSSENPLGSGLNLQNLTLGKDIVK